MQQDSEILGHRAFLATLPSEVRTRLVILADAPGLWHLASHVGAIFVTGTWIILGLPLWWAALPIHGILLVFLFTLEHEATHKTPFKTGWINDWVGRVSGLILCVPFTWFRYFHLAHHRHTHDPAHDPELAGGGLPTRRIAYFWQISGLPFWASMIKTVVLLAVGRSHWAYLPKTAHPKAVEEARVMLLIYAGAFASLLVSDILLWLWIVPVLIGQPFLRLYLMAEHGRCPHVANMFDNTRTTYTNRLMRWLAWNMPYHAEHHAWPSVPFHALPELHGLVRTHLRQTSDGYTAFHTATFKQISN